MNKPDQLDIAYSRLMRTCDICKDDMEDLFIAYNGILDRLNQINCMGYLCEECILRGRFEIGGML